MEELNLSKSVELEFSNFMNRDRWIPSNECKEGYSYLVNSRNLGSIAICSEFSDTGLIFIGLREKLNSYYISSEIHYDDDQYFGTLRPLALIGKAPDLSNETDLMDWFLDQEIDLAIDIKTRLDNMPLKYKRTKLFNELKLDNQANLEDLSSLKINGFKNLKPKTFKSIIEQSKNSN